MIGTRWSPGDHPAAAFAPSRIWPKGRLDDGLRPSSARGAAHPALHRSPASNERHPAGLSSISNAPASPPAPEMSGVVAPAHPPPAGRRDSPGRVEITSAIRGWLSISRTGDTAPRDGSAVDRRLAAGAVEQGAPANLVRASPRRRVTQRRHAQPPRRGALRRRRRQAEQQPGPNWGRIGAEHQLQAGLAIGWTAMP